MNRREWKDSRSRTRVLWTLGASLVLALVIGACRDSGGGLSTLLFGSSRWGSARWG
jgi:hypothetical protein